MPIMSLIDQIQKRVLPRDEGRKMKLRLSCLRMVKTALTLRQTEKMGPLDDKESQQVLSNTDQAAERFGGAVHQGWAAGDGRQERPLRSR